MIARPCPRHESPRTCEQIVKARASATGTWLAEVVNGRHKKPWPGVETEHALPFVCGKHVATGGVK